MIIFLIGKNGQLSSELNYELSIMHKVFAVDRYKLSLSKVGSLEQLIDQVKPDLILMQLRILKSIKLKYIKI